MGKYLKIFIALAIPALLMAGEGEAAQKYFELTGRHTDFVPRVFNFILLAGLLVYLLKEPLKKMLQERTDLIASELNEIEAKRQAAKDEKIKAEKALEAAKARAAEIVEDAKKEITLIKDNIQKHTEQELHSLEKIFNDKCEIESRKTIRETTLKVLNENIGAEDIPLDAQKIVNIVTKEVA